MALHQGQANRLRSHGRGGPRIFRAILVQSCDITTPPGSSPAMTVDGKCVSSAGFKPFSRSSWPPPDLIRGSDRPPSRIVTYPNLSTVIPAHAGIQYPPPACE